MRWGEMSSTLYLKILILLQYNMSYTSPYIYSHHDCIANALVLSIVVWISDYVVWPNWGNPLLCGLTVCLFHHITLLACALNNWHLWTCLLPHPNITASCSMTTGQFIVIYFKLYVTTLQYCCSLAQWSRWHCNLKISLMRGKKVLITLSGSFFY